MRSHLRRGLLHLVDTEDREAFLDQLLKQVLHTCVLSDRGLGWGDGRGQIVFGKGGRGRRMSQLLIADHLYTLCD